MRLWQTMVAQMMRQPTPAGNWWLAGGINSANAVAAYQPKGAASLAASYVNLANPGTYDAYTGVAPGWSAAAGWTWTGAQYLFVDITAQSGWSMAVRFSNAGTGLTGLAGRASGSNRFAILCSDGSGKTAWWNNADQRSAPNQTSGVLVMTPTAGYHDGESVISYSASWASNVGPLTIGYVNAFGAGLTGTIEAVAIWSTALTSGQASAVSSAMAAL